MEHNTQMNRRITREHFNSQYKKAQQRKERAKFIQQTTALYDRWNNFAAFEHNNFNQWPNACAAQPFLNWYNWRL